MVSINSVAVHSFPRLVAKTWIVDASGTGDFLTIQDAVNAANNGDTVFIKNGTYFEHVNLYGASSRNGATSINIVGESQSVIVDGNGTGTVFSGVEDTMSSANSNVSYANLTIRNADCGIYGGGHIKFGGPQTIAISDFRVENCKVGISGSYLDATVTDNLFLNNTVAVSASNSDCALVNNSILLSQTGLTYSYSSCNMTGNRIFGNEIGIDSSYVDVSILSDNSFEYNDQSLSLGYDNVLSAYHNNFISNTQNVYVAFINNDYPTARRVWDNGYPNGGNYWSDYRGVDHYGGKYQNETGSDGIGDTPYIIDQNDSDNFPFMNPLYISVNPLPTMKFPPFSRFSYSPNNPSIFDTIVFDASSSVDVDGTIVSYKFDFGDGTNSTSTQPIFTHAYLSLGDYNVTLLVVDNDYLNSAVIKTISIGKIVSTISLSVSTTVLTIGDNISLSWSINPIPTFQDVTLYSRLSGQNWTILMHIQAPVRGIWFSFYLWTPPQPGDYQVKANWTGDEYTAPAESNIIDVECVRIGTSVLIFTTAESKLVGFYVNISGYLLNQYGKGIQSETVVLFYNFEGTNTWTPITSDNTKADGSYAVTWFPTATGSFTIKAEWAGNDTYSQSYNDVTLTSLPYNNQYVFTVQSNSAVSDMSFDQQKRELNFSATGQEGTIGRTAVTIAKSLVSDVGTLKVRIDGIESNFTVADFGDSWVISFSYHYSTHEVEIYLGAASTNNPFLTNLILYVIIAVGIGMLVSVYVIRKKRQKGNKT